MAIESTLVLVKPDATQRGLAGAVLSRLEQLRLDVIGAKVVRVSRALAEEHYRELRSKPFFEELLNHLQGNFHGGAPVFAFVFQGDNAIQRVRDVTGSTHPEKADPFSLRGSLGRISMQGVMENVLHASASLADAEREIRLWFKPDDLLPRRPAS